jgi:hypothetical protein
MEVNGQLLTTEEEAPIPIGYKSGWTPEPAWKNISGPCRELDPFPDHPAHSLSLYGLICHSYMRMQDMDNMAGCCVHDNERLGSIKGSE